MQSDHVITEIKLHSGNILKVYDLTKVYFGDYYHVRLEIKGEITSLTSDKTAVYHRMLEKMAVPSANVDSALQALLSEFVSNSLHYLNSPDFAEKYVAISSARKAPAMQRQPWTSIRA